MRILANDLHNFLGKKVTVEGWVNSRRDHGGLIFIDLRDHTDIIQLVVTPDTKSAFKLAESVRDEYVLKATGTMRKRTPELINPNINTGKIELVVEELTLLNKSEPLPVNTHDDGAESSEELRLKYRYLDLRRPSMQARLARRSEYYRIIRDISSGNCAFYQSQTRLNTPGMGTLMPETFRDVSEVTRQCISLFELEYVQALEAVQKFTERELRFRWLSVYMPPKYLLEPGAFDFANLYNPRLEPNESISPFICPMIITFSEPLISSSNASFCIP